MKNQNKSAQPLVSVIIPVFNGALYLIEAVDSVFKSTYKNIEVILIDDGSKDASKMLCAMLEKKYNDVRFYSMPRNRGLGRTLNFAIKQAKGELICRLNQDDIMLPNRIETQVKYFQTHPKVVAAGSWIRLFEENGKTQIVKFLATDKQIKKAWMIVSPFADPSVMYRKSAVIKAGLYKQEFWPGDDTHLWYRMGMLGQLANIQKPLVEVRYHSGAASVRYFRKLTESTFRMHRWAHNNIEHASLTVQLFWIVQFVLGMILPANFNWQVYRILKKVLNYASNFKGFLIFKSKQTKAKRIAIPHPKRLSLSGQ